MIYISKKWEEGLEEQPQVPDNFYTIDKIILRIIILPSKYRYDVNNKKKKKQCKDVHQYQYQILLEQPRKGTVCMIRESVTQQCETQNDTGNFTAVVDTARFLELSPSGIRGAGRGGGGRGELPMQKKLRHTPSSHMHCCMEITDIIPRIVRSKWADNNKPRHPSCPVDRVLNHATRLNRLIP